MKLKKFNRKGFSLVELIVVIAIMAIMIAVLAPSLLSYVERSRAQKDDSAMSEVTNAIMLALADQDVYDEVLCYTVDGMYSCYIDSLAADGTIQATPAGESTNAVETKDKMGDPGTYTDGDHFIYNDNERLQDEVPYVFAGKMRGMTITFKPDTQTSNKSTFVLCDGIINAVNNGESFADTQYIYGAAPENMTFGTMCSSSAAGHNYLYNRVRATVGDKIELSSQTYRNSNYTVFVRMGTTGGNQADKQDAIMVYGQWSGTNLSIGSVGGAGGSGSGSGGNASVDGLNQYGFYYGEYYSLEIDGDKMSVVFFADGSCECYMSGALDWKSAPYACVYGTKSIEAGFVGFFNDTSIATVSEDGKSILLVDGVTLSYEEGYNGNSGSNISMSHTLETMSWEQIRAISEAGNAEDYFNIGDTKTIPGVGTVKIAGFNHDDLSDGSGKAGITFVLVDSYKNAHNMNNASDGYQYGDNLGGWQDSEMRSWLNGDVYSSLPTDLKSVIKKVDKIADNGYDGKALETSSDWLWLLSTTEVGLNPGYDIDGQGTQYAVFTDDASRANGIYDWWLRSSYIYYDYYFCHVSYDGSYNYNYAYNADGVVFGFCV